MKKIATTFTLVLVVVILALSIFFSKKISAIRAESQKAVAGQRSSAVTVKTDFVKNSAVRNVLTFNGDIKAMHTVSLQAKVSGRLKSLSLEDGTAVEEGTRVRKGQLIGQLDDREYQAKYQSAIAAVSAANANRASAAAGLECKKADLESEKANLDDKQREYNRMENLVKQQAGTQQSLDQAETALAQAKADFAAAQAELAGAEASVEQAEAAWRQSLANKDEAELDLAETKIYSPMDGVISARHLDPGVQVSASTPLVTILDIDTIKAVISVPVNRLSLVIPGKTRGTLRSVSRPGDRIACTVEKIYPSVDSVTRTAQVELRVENPLCDDGTYHFLPGMYATVDLLLEERLNVVTVDVSLPIRNIDKQLIFVCDGDKVRAVPVTLGLTTGGQVEVLEGLNAGDEIVVQGQHRLTDGSEINRVNK